ncbi:MAG: hypothetical protein ABR616_15755 [Dermatophilaceae bacterium]|nr:hypothetical protein [Intrasporangiaceae bacterium]
MSESRRRIRDSRAQEARGAKLYGGVRSPGSGNGARKGDMRVTGKNWLDPAHRLFEYKRTDKRQITLRAEDLEKIQYEAASTGRIPVFAIEVGGQHYVLEREGDYRENHERIAELEAKLEETGRGSA